MGWNTYDGYVYTLTRITLINKHKIADKGLYLLFIGAQQNAA